MATYEKTPEGRRQHAAYQRAYMKRYIAQMSPERLLAFRAAVGDRGRKWAKANLRKLADKNARQHRANREIVILKYGGECACCGENQGEFLTIDHIAPLRKRTGREVSRSFYLRLKREPIDPNLQVLCWNCNHAKGVGGECPHKRIYAKKFTLLRGIA